MRRNRRGRAVFAAVCSAWRRALRPWSPTPRGLRPPRGLRRCGHV